MYRFASDAFSGAGLTAEELVDPELAEGASRIALADLPDVEDRLHDGLARLFTDEDAVRLLFGQILQAEDGVHRIADDGVIHFM